jgi:GTPase SAR1 family protein
MYFRGAIVAILVFDLTDRRSFDDVPGWADLLERNVDGCTVALVGNKSDLPNREISWDEGDDMRSKIRAAYYYETSAQNGENINELFFALAEALSKSRFADEIQAQNEKQCVVLKKENSEAQSGGKGCC